MFNIRVGKTNLPDVCFDTKTLSQFNTLLLIGRLGFGYKEDIEDIRVMWHTALEIALPEPKKEKGKMSTCTKVRAQLYDYHIAVLHNMMCAMKNTGMELQLTGGVPNTITLVSIRTKQLCAKRIPSDCTNWLSSGIILLI